MLPISVAADQLAYVFATAAITSPDDLLTDEVLQVLRQRDIHGAHSATIARKGGSVPANLPPSELQTLIYPAYYMYAG